MYCGPDITINILTPLLLQPGEESQGWKPVFITFRMVQCCWCTPRIGKLVMLPPRVEQVHSSQSTPSVLFNPPNSNLTKDDLGVREILVSGWANFAKTGTPNVPTTDFWQKSSWKGSWPVNYMNITGPYSFAMEARPETAKRVEFWEGFLWTDLRSFWKSKTLFLVLIP